MFDWFSCNFEKNGNFCFSQIFHRFTGDLKKRMEISVLFKIFRWFTCNFEKKNGNSHYSQYFPVIYLQFWNVEWKFPLFKHFPLIYLQFWKGELKFPEIQKFSVYFPAIWKERMEISVILKSCRGKWKFPYFQNSPLIYIQF